MRLPVFARMRRLGCIVANLGAGRVSTQHCGKSVKSHSPNCAAMQSATRRERSRRFLPTPPEACKLGNGNGHLYNLMSRMWSGPEPTRYFGILSLTV